MADEPIFEGKKKKKSKKPVEAAPEEAEEAPAPPPPEDDEMAVFTEKKKKKKKKVVEETAEEPAEEPAAEPSAAEPRTENQLEEEENALLFDGEKKKKKKKKKKSADEDGEGAAPPEEEAAPPAEEDGEDPLSFLGEKKKKKSKKSKKAAVEEPEPADDGDDAAADPEALAELEAEAEADDPEGPAFGEDHDGPVVEGWLGSDRDYEYNELLNRVYHILRENNPELMGEKRRYTIAPPQVAREGSKKTVFANVADIARRMKRNPEHLVQFVFAELGTSGSVDASERLIIKGRFQPKMLEGVLKRYIVEYVTCKTCKSPETTLSKDNRLWFMNCEACGSRRTVATISAGFKAQTTKRSRMRAG